MFLTRMQRRLYGERHSFKECFLSLALLTFEVALSPFDVDDSLGRHQFLHFSWTTLLLHIFYFF